MRRTQFIALVVLTLAGVVATAGPAAADPPRLRPVVVNPCGGPTSNTAVSQWVAQQGTNRNDPNFFALQVTDNDTGDCTIAAVDVANMGGRRLNRLRMSVRNDTLANCSANTRWNLLASGRNFYWILCDDGAAAADPAATPGGVPAFTQFTYNDASVTPVCHLTDTLDACDGPVTRPFVFGQTIVRSLDLINDSGTTFLDNIKVNDPVFGKP